MFDRASEEAQESSLSLHRCGTVRRSECVPLGFGLPDAASPLPSGELFRLDHLPSKPGRETVARKPPSSRFSSLTVPP